MGVTLMFDNDDETYWLSRANARITTSAILSRGDEIEVADVLFYVDRIRHNLGDIRGDVAPTTYAYLKRPDNLGSIGPHSIMKLKMQGFKDGTE